MIQKMEWIQRKFSFDLPAEMFPNIIERLRGTPARVVSRIGHLTPEQLTQRDGDQWSIQENVGHLYEVESLFMGRLKEFLAGKETLRPADMSNTRTNEANYNAGSIEDIMSSFWSARLAFVQGLEECDAKTVLHKAMHPRLKTEMRLLDHAFFAAEHDDHHLARITELMNILGMEGAG